MLVMMIVLECNDTSTLERKSYSCYADLPLSSSPSYWPIIVLLLLIVASILRRELRMVVKFLRPRQIEEYQMTQSSYGSVLL